MALLRIISDILQTRSHPRAKSASLKKNKISSINQRIFDTSQDLILVVGKFGEFIRVSPSIQTILGFRVEDVVGLNGQNFIHPDDLEPTRHEMRRLRRGDPLHSFNCRYIHRNGTSVPLVWTGVWSEEDEQFFFIGRDATAHASAEKEAWRQQQLEAITQLTGGIAHDFNNLLAVIIGSLEMLDPYLRNDLEAGEHLLSALNAALRGADLTKELLAYSSRGSLNVREVDVNTCIREACAAIRDSLPATIELKLVLDTDVWSGHCDADRLHDAVVGLCYNAIAAMPNGGQLTIQTRNRKPGQKGDPDDIELPPGDFVAISVRDTGTGMSSAVQSKVLEPYFTTKPEGSGAGLGLSIIDGFIRQMQGHLKIDSTLGRGTRVSLFIPRFAPGSHQPGTDVEVQASSQDSPSPSVGSVATAGGQPIILVVEDNPDVRRVVLGQLHGLDYHTIDVESAEAALEILESRQQVDLMFTDVLLPGGMSGTDLAIQARELRPELRILLTSGYVGSSVSVATDFQNFLPKPYRRAQLDAAIKALLS